jgi:hypothetical protein
LGSATAVNMVTDRPSSAAFSAVEHPATPLPMTSKSASPISDNEASGAVVAEAVVASRPPSVLASGVLKNEADVACEDWNGLVGREGSTEGGGAEVVRW